MVNKPVNNRVQTGKSPPKTPKIGKNKENQTNKMFKIIFLVSSKHGHFLCKI